MDDIIRRARGIKEAAFVTTIGKTRRIWLYALMAVAFLANAGTAGAASGDWASFDHSAVRLIAGAAAADTRGAGLEIRLAEGWKTYWRMPGESGAPPDFDWTGSTNVASVEVAWPVPHRMHDEGGESIGYKQQVVFPLTVRLAKPGQPAHLDLKLFYAVCKDICVPANAAITLDLGPEPPLAADAALIERYRALVPVDDEAGKRLIAAHGVVQAGKPYLAVVLADSLAVKDIGDIFVEGFEKAYFRAPLPGATTGQGNEFLLPVDGIADAAALSGQHLRITVVAGNKSLFRDLKVE